MIADYKQGEIVTETTYRLKFTKNHKKRYGYSFPCNEKGVVDRSQLTEEGVKNLMYCMSNPSQFTTYKEIVPITTTYHEPSSGTCVCGERIYLTNQYMGACECPVCGKWYNMSGQELVPPDYWDMGEDYEGYDY